MTDGGVEVAQTDQDTATATVHATDLTAFQQYILAIVAEEARYGLAIKGELDAHLGEKVNHGRLYPNLDKLEQLGLIEISALDKRTNEYAITDAGRDLIEAHARWFQDRLGLLEPDADEETVYVYRARNKSSQTPLLHFDPTCRGLGGAKSCDRKPLSVFPKSHQRWCSHCAPLRGDKGGEEA